MAAVTTVVSEELMLAWGRQYAMVRPDAFRVAYRINPFMDPADQPDLGLARAQWQTLVDTIEASGGSVQTIPARADSPDMVYAMNLGLALADDHGARVAVSHMRFPERRRESDSATRWFSERGLAPTYVGRAGVGPHLEAGDAFPFAGRLVVGYGPRTEELALKHLAAEFDLRVQGMRLTHAAMYHLDLAFCPLDAATAMVCPAALDKAGKQSTLIVYQDLDHQLRDSAARIDMLTKAATFLDTNLAR